MERRQFLRGAATATGAAAAATVASSFPAPAIAQDRMRWRMVTAWPKNYPGLGTSANLLAEMIGRMSGGRLEVEVYGAGEIVPAFEALDAVSGGTVEMGHGTPYYWKGKAEAAQFLTCIPFGLTATEMNAWYMYGGGQELADNLYQELGCKFFVSGNTDVQMAGWFNKEINSLQDLRGLKMRLPGLGGEVLAAAGVNIVNLPGGEILPALQSGAIDAADWVSPYNDLAFGLYKTARYYYYPGWQEPGPATDCFVNLAKWEALPDDLKAVIEAAAGASARAMLNEFTARNGPALTTLVNDHNVELKRFPDEVLAELARLSEEVVNDIASRSEQSREILDSMLKFRKDAVGWSKVSTLAYLQDRDKAGGFGG